MKPEDEPDERDAPQEPEEEVAPGSGLTEEFDEIQRTLEAELESLTHEVMEPEDEPDPTPEESDPKASTHPETPEPPEPEPEPEPEPADPDPATPHWPRSGRAPRGKSWERTPSPEKEALTAGRGRRERRAAEVGAEAEVAPGSRGGEGEAEAAEGEAGLGALRRRLADHRLVDGDRACGQRARLRRRHRRGPRRDRRGLDRLDEVDGGDPQTILILGSDIRPTDDTGRSDTTLLLRVDPDSDSINLLSIPPTSR